MAFSEILREFLVRIKYDVDKGSERDFTTGLTKATELVGGLGAAMEVTAGAVLAGVAKMAEGLERFYFISQRTGASVAGLKALGYAADQMGIGADAAYSAVERLSSFLRSSPLAGQALQRFGIVVSSDPTKTLQSMGAAFQRLPIAMARALAQVVGIDENTMLAMRRGTGAYLQTYNEILKRLGVNEEHAAETSHNFMVQLRTTGAWLGALGDKIMDVMGDRITGLLHKFTDAVTAHADQIVDALGRAITWVLKAGLVIFQWAMAAVDVTSRVYKSFQSLPPVIQKVVEALLAVAAVLSFIDWPVAAVLALGAAVYYLYDNWTTFTQRAGKLIDWPRWKPDFDYAWAAITRVSKAVWDFGVAIAQGVNWKPDYSYVLSGVKEMLTSFKDLGRTIAQGYIDLGLFIGKLYDLSGGIKNKDLFSKSAIIKDIDDIIKSIGDLARAIGGIARFYTALANHDWKGVLNASRDVMRAFGVEPHDDGVGMPGEDQDTRTFWQKFAPRWLGGKTAPAAPLSDFTKQQQGPAFQFWKAHGFTDEGAAAMVATEQRESKSDPNAVGDYSREHPEGGAHGLFQWHSDRAATIREWTGIDVTKDSAEEQRRAMFLEMYMHLDKMSGAAYKYIRDNKSTLDATKLITGMVERPADIPGESAVRAGMAANVLNSQTGATVHMDQTNVYHIHGATDPKSTATAVGAAQDTSNQRLTRNVSSAVQ